MVTAETIRQALQCGQPGCTCGQSGGNVHCPAHEDDTPSLSVSEKNGKILVKCHGGCTQDRTIEALKDRGLWISGNGDGTPTKVYTLQEFSQDKNLSPDFLRKHHVSEHKNNFGNIEVRFHYLDEAKTLVSVRRRIARSGDKFRWRKGDKVIIYGLWELAAIQKAGWCLIVEGESDLLTAWLHKVPALSIPGKSTWQTKWAKYFKGLQPYLWQEPDAVDLPGKMGKDLPGLLVIPAPASFKDISEAHLKGHDVAALIADLKARARPPEPNPTIINSGFSLSDLGNARRLVAQFGANIRYCYPWGKWLIFDDQRWGKDEIGGIDLMGKKIPQIILTEAAEISDQKIREATAQHALRSESESKRNALIASAQSEPGIPILPEALDRDPWLLNVINGTLDLRKGELRPHRREDLISKMAPVEFLSGATCPLFLKFLDRIMAGNQELITFLQKAVGYALTGDTREQCLFFLYGLGANGKTTFLEVMTTLLGDYSLQTSSDTFMVKPRGGNIPNDVAALRGARFVTAIEVEVGRRMAEVLIKQMTGGDKVAARFLHGEFFEFTPTFKIFLCANHKPVIRGSDHAIWRRIRLIPFTVAIPPEEQDKELPQKLKKELPGILNWALAGCLQWQYGGLKAPQEVVEATKTYQEEMDTLGDFLAEKCLCAPGATSTAAELYSAYSKWAEDCGEKRPLTQRAFGMSLTERGFQRDRGASGKHIWWGIGLKAE